MLFRWLKLLAAVTVGPSNSLKPSLLWLHQTLNGIGRPRNVMPPMLDALCEHLLEKPNLYQDKMAIFLWDEFEVLVTTFSIGRALASIGWTKKAARRVAKGRNADLRDFYLHNLSAFRSYHLVYVDESDCDKRIGFRRTGWSPLGVTPTQVAQFQREHRYQMLPAYARDGVILARVCQGSTDSTVFEDFIEQLLPISSLINLSVSTPKLAP